MHINIGIGSISNKAVRGCRYLWVCTVKYYLTTRVALAWNSCAGSSTVAADTL